MKNLPRSIFLHLHNALYQLAKPLIFCRDAQFAHESAMRFLSSLDDNENVQQIIEQIRRLSLPDTPACVGGVNLPHPMILAAGFVKGHGFANETEALRAVNQEINIIPGWRTMPNIVGPVEFGSFTRWPRVGNPGTVIWRDRSTYSTQNRVGLKNPGVKAAAEFLSRRSTLLPKPYGINIAVTPGLDDMELVAEEIRESLGTFLSCHVIPSWFTLNISCPNTDDDPGNRQTQKQTYHLCNAAQDFLEKHSAAKVPLWVKISPGLSREQYQVLSDVFNDTNIPAVIATNTLGQPTPDNTGLSAGVGGGRLHQHALDAVSQLQKTGYKGDVIGCGGIIDPLSYMCFQHQGAKAMQYWSAMVYRGPLAAASILNEVLSYEQ